MVIRISKSLAISPEKVREILSDQTGKIFNEVADEIILKVADTISIKLTNFKFNNFFKIFFSSEKDL